MRSFGAALVAVLIVAGCERALPNPRATPTSAAASPATAAHRLGTRSLLSPAAVPIGSFAATEESAGQTRLEVTLDDRGNAHPWGIWDQATCGRPAENHDAPFQFADVEDGRRTEKVETQGFLGFPTNLVVLVFGPDGGTIEGCADLGGPTAAFPSQTLDTCRSAAGDGTGADAGVGGDGLLAFSFENLANADIYTMRPDGSGRRRLTTAVGIDVKPTWSPDGLRIAFRSTRSGNDDIWTMDADGSCQRNFTNDPADDRSPAWSPDGCSIAFDHFFNDQFQDVAIKAVDGSGAIRRVTTASGEYPSWSPDGARLAFASARDGDYEIYVIDADGRHEQQLTNDPGYQMYPAWSPDGKWIAYESGPDSFSHLGIHVMHPDGTGDQVLVDAAKLNRFPAWSADGRLAWATDGQLVIADSLHAPPRPIGPGQFPAWSPVRQATAKPSTPGGARAC